MFKKISFCLTLVALSNNVVYASEKKTTYVSSYEPTKSNILASLIKTASNLQPKLTAINGAAIGAFMKTVTYGTVLAAIVLLNEDRSVGKETAVSLLPTMMVAGGIAGI